MQVASIVGTGMYVPDRVVTNAELSKWMNTSPEWIVERTGIEERRWVSEPEGPSSLAVPAAQQALKNAGWDKADVDLIIFATLSSDRMFPGSGCLFQAKMDMQTIPALDIRNQCSGFLYGLHVARGLIASGTHKKILLIGAETHSTGLDVTTEGRGVSVIFGDGAGVACIEASDRGGVIGPVHIHADGSGEKHLTVVAPATDRRPIFSYDILNAKEHTPHMDGQPVFRAAVRRLAEVAQETLEEAQLEPSDLGLVVPHQANMRINAMISQKLGIPDENVVHNIQKYGNTTAASIPIALHEAIEAGRTRKGEPTMLIGFGAGFTWGAGLIHW